MSQSNDGNEMTIAAMNREHIATCARVIGQNPLFQEYGLTVDGAVRMFEAELQNDNNTLIVAQTSENQTAGFAWFVQKGAFARSGYLRLIAVAPEAHGKGIGKALLQWLEQHFLQPSGIVLLTSRHNHNARAFYQRLGYTQIGEIPNYVKDGLHERIYFKPAPT